MVTPFSTALTMSYTASAATLTAVSASISTPVLSTVLTRARTVSSPRRTSSSKVMSTPVMRSGWQSGISSWVRLAARMPAVRATPRTSPFGALPARTSRSVRGAIRTTAWATASRAVSAFADTSTMRASPRGVTWVRPRADDERRGMKRPGCRAASGRDARLSDDGLHAVLGHQLELLELGNTPLLFGRERGRSFERLQLVVIALMLTPETAELLVLGHESL